MAKKQIARQQIRNPQDPPKGHWGYYKPTPKEICPINPNGEWHMFSYLGKRQCTWCGTKQGGSR